MTWTTTELLLAFIVAGQNLGLLAGYYANERDRRRRTETPSPTSELTN